MRVTLNEMLPGSGYNTPKEVERLNALLRAVSALRSPAWAEATDILEEELSDLAYQEPIVLQGLLQTVAPVVMQTVMPSSRLLRSLATSRPFDGRILRDWAATMEAEDIRRIHAAVQVGLVSGESMSRITSRVLGGGDVTGADGVTALTRRQVQAITRTAVQHVANNARDAFMRENADIVETEVFVATLDARTTPVCRANDGKRFPLGRGPRPPLHWQCRSLRVAALDGEVLGQRPFKASTTRQLLNEFASANKLGKLGSRDDIPRGMKGAFDSFARKRIRELTGRVPGQTTYQQWLERQSREFQEDTLGVTKAKLFRNGELKLDKFVAEDGTELTLAQLAGKHAEAFRKAGLDPEDFI